MDTKKCSRCKKVKMLSEYNYKIKRLNRLSYHCKECSRKYIRSHYLNNRDYYLFKAKKRNKAIRIEIKQFIWTYLTTHFCIDCGEKDPVVLEFDHVKDKLFNVSAMGRSRTLLEVKREIKKCVIRCANCHRRKTALQLGWHKKIMPL